jgi:hypothetical protein
MGTPDNPVHHRIGTVGCPVRRHVTQLLGSGARSTVGALSSCGTGQSGAPLTSLHWLLHGTIAHCSSCQSRPLRELVVAPVAHRTVRWIIADGACKFSRVATSDLYGYGAPNTVRWHTGQSGVPDHNTLKSFLLLLNWVPNLNIYFFCVESYAPVIHEFYSKLVSPYICVGHSTTINCRKRLTYLPFNLSLFGDWCQHKPKQIYKVQKWTSLHMVSAYVTWN